MERIYLFSSGPREWMAQHIPSGLAATGESREAAIRLFKQIWLDRADYRFIDGAPPRAPRPGFAGDAADAADKQAAAGVKLVEEPGARVFAELIKSAHPDHHPDRTFTGTEVVAMLVRLRDAMRVA